MHLYTKLKIIWIIVFTFLVTASLSKETGGFQLFGIDIIFHLIIYAVLSFIPIISIRKRLDAFMVTIAIAPLGILFEIIHGMITGYGFETLDAFYNNIGIMIGVLAATALRLKRHYENESKIEP